MRLCFSTMGSDQEAVLSATTEAGIECASCVNQPSVVIALVCNLVSDSGQSNRDGMGHSFMGELERRECF